MIEEITDKQRQRCERLAEEFDEKQDGEHIGIIGYHYWLFDDAIARIDIPDGILEKYASKYANL